MDRKEIFDRWRPLALPDRTGDTTPHAVPDPTRSLPQKKRLVPPSPITPRRP